MRTIWKFPMQLGPNLIEMPKGAKFLAGGISQGQMSSWFEVETDAPIENRRFVIYGTGHGILEGCNYLTTIPDADGFHIWHVYEHVVV